MKTSFSINALLTALAAALILGCAQAKPYEYHPATEMPKGPGLFTGEKGEYTLYSSKKNADSDADSKRPSNDAAAADAREPADDAEFSEFQKWRKERQDFEAFQEWKRSPEGQAEYREFQDWQRWRDYKKWQESQSGNR
jgi:hypothetical protein